MANYGNRAKVATATTGTGDITLGAAVTGYQTFAQAGIGVDDTVNYVIEDSADWEIGTGVISAPVSPDVYVMTRTVTESSNSDSAINLSGAATVFIDVPSSYFNASEDYGLITSSATATDDYGSIT